MLTVRSKVLIGIASVGIVAPIYRYIAEGGTWQGQPEPGTEDSHIGWIILGVLIVAAILSVVIDVRKNRTPS
jgi:hypothetical protein